MKMVRASVEGQAEAAPVAAHPGTVVHTVPSQPATAKAVFDRCFALLALAFFAPFMALVAAAIYATDGGPVFYGHTRIGRNGRRFRCLKFRTMVNDAERQLARLLEESPEARREWSETMKLRDDPRVHLVGRFLRKSSLDELPQFFNVLRGEMSIVGPRPIVEDEIWRYGDAYRCYAAVNPGITGAWQVSGRNDVGYRTRVQMDVDYVQNRSFAGDVKIVMATILIVLKGRGAY